MSRSDPRLSLEKRQEMFYAKVDKTNTCWMWVGRVNAWGYGNCSFKGRNWLAHRLSYTWEKGEIPKGLELDHLCRNTFCVKPSHLEAVTHHENMSRGVTAKKTSCKRGHEFNTTNTYKTPDGRRDCRVCRRVRKSLPTIKFKLGAVTA